MPKHLPLLVIGALVVGLLVRVTMQAEYIQDRVNGGERRVIIDMRTKTRTWWFKENDGGPLQQDTYSSTQGANESFDDFCKRFDREVAAQQAGQIVCPPPE